MMMCKYKKVIFAALILVLIFVLSGCTTEYKREDIKNYVKEEIGLKNFKVSSKYREVTDEDDYKDRIWGVFLPKENIEFHVMDDYYWGMESLDNSLRTDYDAAILNNIKGKLSKQDNISINIIEEKSGMYQAEIIGKFTDKIELKSCCDAINRLRYEIAQIGYPKLSIGYTLKYDHKYRKISDEEDKSGDYSGNISKACDYEKAMKNFCTAALSYRYDVTETFTKEEIEKALDGYFYFIGIYRDKDKTNIEFYDDIIGNPYAYGVSYSSFYEILKREGFNPTGNRWHYSFVGKNNTRYEVSYEFDDYYFAEENKYGYYYLENGNKVPMACYFYKNFTAQEIEKMTGLLLKIGQKI